jgi:hypothetical protein
VRLIPFLTLTGILTLIFYGVSRTVTASRLVYLIDNAAFQGNQLAVLITAFNTQGVPLTQKSITAQVLVNNIPVSTIADTDETILSPGVTTPQGYVMDIPAGALAGQDVRLIQVRGVVTVDNIATPLNLKYKFI